MAIDSGSVASVFTIPSESSDSSSSVSTGDVTPLSSAVKETEEVVPLHDVTDGGSISVSSGLTVGAHGDESRATFGYGSFGYVSAGETTTRDGEFGVITHSADSPLLSSVSGHPTTANTAATLIDSDDVTDFGTVTQADIHIISGYGHRQYMDGGYGASGIVPITTSTDTPVVTPGTVDVGTATEASSVSDVSYRTPTQATSLEATESIERLEFVDSGSLAHVDVSPSVSGEVSATVGNAELTEQVGISSQSFEVGRSPDVPESGQVTATFSTISSSAESVSTMETAQPSAASASVSFSSENPETVEAASITDVVASPIWSTEVPQGPQRLDTGSVSEASVSSQSSTEWLWAVDEGESASSSTISSAATESLTVSDTGLLTESVASVAPSSSTSSVFDEGFVTASSVSSSETAGVVSSSDDPFPAESVWAPLESTQELTASNETGRLAFVSGIPTLGIGRSDSPAQFDVGVVTPTTANSSSSVEDSSSHDVGDTSPVDGHSRIGREESVSFDSSVPVSGVSTSLDAITVPNAADGGAVTPELVTPISEYEVRHSTENGSVTPQSVTPNLGLTVGERLDYDGGSVTASTVAPHNASEASSSVAGCYPSFAIGSPSASTERPHTADGGEVSSAMVIGTESTGIPSAWDDGHVSEATVNPLGMLDVSRMSDSGSVHPALTATFQSSELSRSYDDSGVSSGLTVPLTPTLAISYTDVGGGVTVGTSTRMSVEDTHSRDLGIPSMAVSSPISAVVRSGSVDIIRIIERTIGWSVEEQDRGLSWDVVRNDRPVDWDVEEDERTLDT